MSISPEMQGMIRVMIEEMTERVICELEMSGRLDEDNLYTALSRLELAFTPMQSEVDMTELEAALNSPSTVPDRPVIRIKGSVERQPRPLDQ